MYRKTDKERDQGKRQRKGDIKKKRQRESDRENFFSVMRFKEKPIEIESDRERKRQRKRKQQREKQTEK